jgi:Tol biopolymer transport system component
MAAPFDARHLRVLGPGVTVLDGLLVKLGGATEASVSNNGTLVFSEGSATRQLVLVDHSGAARVLPLAAGQYDDPRASPTGDRIALSVTEPATAKSDIWVYSQSLGTMTRLTHDGQSGGPEWTAEGKRIAWSFGDDTMLEFRWQPSDGDGQAATLFAAKQKNWAVSFSPAGGLVTAVHSQDGIQAELVVASIDSTATMRPLIKTASDAFTPRISPDGRWIAYGSDESGANEIYVASMSGSGGRMQVSTAGGLEPVWAPDGHTIYYRTAGRMMAATVVTSPAFLVTRRDSLFADTYVTGIFFHSYDVTRDGKAFVMLRNANRSQRAIVVFGWLDELRERMALAAKR